MKNNAQKQTTNAPSLESIIAQALQAPAKKNAKRSDEPFDIMNVNFKSIETSFGKMWGAKGKGVTLWVDGQPNDATYLERVTQGVLKSVPEKNQTGYESYQRIRKSVIGNFEGKSYALDTDKRNNVLAYMPAQLCKDLQVVRNLRIKAKFMLEVAEDDNSVSVRYVKYVPRKKNPTEAEVTYGNIGTEATTVYVADSKHPLFNVK